MTLDLRHMRFLKSANKLSDLPPDTGAEVAFAGRSNAGKSSALNRITGVKGLARTSKTPGRTQLINLFTLDPERRFADLPGYGYAQVPEKIRNHWRALLDSYFRSRESLRGVILVMDIRHPLKAFDEQMLDWAAHHGLPVHILLTKADKLSRNQAMQSLQRVSRELADGCSVQLFSAPKGTGVDEVQAVIDEWLAPQ